MRAKLGELQLLIAGTDCGEGLTRRTHATRAAPDPPNLQIQALYEPPILGFGCSFGFGVSHGLGGGS